MPKEGGKRRRTMFGYEKGLIWGNDNYRTNGAYVNIALATGNVGQLGGGVVRLGGHQEGYVRPDYPGPRPAPYIDKLLISGRGGVHHIWACDHYKTTLNSDKFKQAYKKRTDKVKNAMSAAPYGDRKAMVDAIVASIKDGGLFAVDVDIVPTRIGQACHVWLPAATAGEMNLTSMNGERRLRLTERYMDPPGQAKPDCLIAAGVANNLERVFREMGRTDEVDKFKGFDWETEEGAFMDGYHKQAKGGEFVTYERLRTMGTNGVQEPATAFRDGKLVGTQRLYVDGVSTEDGKAPFMDAPWRGLEAPGKEEESKKFAFLINNGRANHVWQSAYLDQKEDLVMDRWPYPFIQINPDDMKDLGLSAGDLVEVFNENGATQAMAYPTPTAKRKQTFMLFAFPTGVQGNVVSAGVNELIIPNYKQTWANIRKTCLGARRGARGELQVVGVQGLGGPQQADKSAAACAGMLRRGEAWLGRAHEGAHELAFDLRGDGVDIGPLAGQKRARVLCGVEARRLDADRVESGCGEFRAVVVLIERPGDAAGPEQHVSPNLLRNRPTGHDIGDSEPAARLQNAERLAQHAILVGGQVDNAVGNDHVDRVVRQRDVFDLALEELDVCRAGLALISRASASMSSVMSRP